MTSLEVTLQLVDPPKDCRLLPEANRPLITDYLDKAVAIRLDYYRVLKTIRMNRNLEQLAIVLR